MDIYNNIEFVQKISININELNSVSQIEDILYIKLKELENKCSEYGYIKENSIKILKTSSGFLNPTIFVPFIEYKLLCKANVFLPNIGDIYLAEVLSLNKIGIMCCVRYKYNNKIIIPIKIIISKHNQDIDLIKNIKKNDKIYVKLLGLKFSKNSTHIDSIANIVSDSYVFNVKKLKVLIEELNSIKHNCIVKLEKIEKYKNILKFILKKEEIEYNELFIYDFIVNNKITIHTTDFLEKYNNYIDNFNKPIIKQNVNTIINSDVNNIELDNETNLETNPEDETNPDLETGYIHFNDNEMSEEIEKDNEMNEDDTDDDDDIDDDDEINDLEDAKLEEDIKLEDNKLEENKLEGKLNNNTKNKKNIVKIKVVKK